MRRWATSSSAMAGSIRGEGEGYGDGGLYGDWISIEEIRFVGPLLDRIQGGPGEFGWAGEDFEVFDDAILADDGVENNATLNPGSLGIGRIDGFHKFVAIACDVAGVNLDRGYGVGLGMGLGGGLGSLDYSRRDDLYDSVGVGCVGDIDLEGRFGLTRCGMRNAYDDGGRADAGGSGRDIDVRRPGADLVGDNLYVRRPGIAWGTADLDVGRPDVTWGSADVDRGRGRSLCLRCGHLLAEGESRGAGPADECDGEHAKGEAGSGAQLRGLVGQVHNSPLEILEGVGIEDSDGVRCGGGVWVRGELGRET